MSTALTVGAFEFPPFTYTCPDAVITSNNISYCGIEILILKAVADTLGKELVIQTPSDGNNFWGQFFYENNTGIGLVRDIFLGVVDVGAGEFFNLGSRNKVIDPSEYYTYDYFCFLLKKPPPVPEWVQLIKPFQPMVWFCFSASLVATIAFLVLFDKVTGLIRSVLLQGIGYFLNKCQEMDISKRSAKLFVFFITFSGLVITSAYSGNLISFLTIRTYPELPHLITDMLDMPGMQWGSTGTTDLKKMVASPNPQINELANQFSLLNYWSEGFERIQDGNFAFLNSLISSDYAIRTQFTDSYGVSSMYIMRECWMLQQIVFYFPKQSLIKRPFDRVLQKLRESGLISKWIQDEMDKLARLEEVARSETQGLPLSLDHLRAAFIISAIVLGISLVAFVIEVTVRFDFIRTGVSKTVFCCMIKADRPNMYP